MGKALYRKYRSRSLDEIVGQDHITSTLSNAIKAGKISHAYLLTGPRGTGKTSIARILAYEINQIPYSDEPHLDIIEIDAASNRRIDEMRDLRDRVNNAPSSATFKVYIIDEVHMLTKEAFNALLKTLEEPPAHVVFILATTEAHKLPETIISRTQRYSFRPVPMDQVVGHLKSIAKTESITIDDEALQLIAEHGEGSFRDSISLLDQASSTSKKISRTDIESLLGRAPTELIERLLSHMNAGDSANVIQDATDLYSSGYEPAMIAQQVSNHLRASYLANPTANRPTLELLAKLLTVPGHHSPKQQLEILLLGATLDVANPVSHTVAPAPAVATQAHPVKTPDVPDTKPEKAPAPQAPARPVDTPKPTPTPAPKPTPEPENETEVVEPTPKPVLADDHDAEALWHEVLQEIKQNHNTLYGIARMAKPQLDGDTLVIYLKFAFHLKRIQEAKNYQILTACIEKLRGKTTILQCQIADVSETTDATAKKPNHVSAISNIFGGAELL